MLAPRRGRSLASMETTTQAPPFRVVIAGGGVAALETLIAVRDLAEDRVRITLLAPDDDFHYRPMAVAEPFEIAHARRVPLARVASDFGAELVAGELVAVEPTDRRAVTRGGERIAYDALVVACGTRMRPAFDGVHTIDDRNLGDTLRGLVQDVEEGYVHDVAFVAPAQALWPLPLYELALQTARRAHDMDVTVAISIVSPEIAPLALFGDGVSRELTRLLRAAGIAFYGGAFAQLRAGELTLRPGDVRLRPSRVVALPLLDGPQIAGLPTDPHGFVAVDALGAVPGLDGVYAAGDVTARPIKHGGIAAQEADVVAAAIAARAGAAVVAQPQPPVIRGMLLTGGAPRWLEAELGGGRSTVSDECPWGEPAKVVARYLAPYLAREDRAPVGA